MVGDGTGIAESFGTLSVDGGPHRLTMIRGETVIVFFSRDKTETGTVAGISHARQEVRVRFRDGIDGQWFPVGAIYPAVDVEREPDSALKDDG